MLNVAPAAWRGIPSIKAPDPRAVTAPDSEFEAVLRAASLPLQFVMLAARECALRAGTIYALTPRHCAGGWVKTVTKNSRVIAVPIPKRLQTLISAASQSLDSVDGLIINLLGAPRTPWMKSWISRELVRAQTRAGCRGRWVLHDLRRTAAHRLYEATGDLHRVKALLGHSSLSSTLIYLHAAPLPITASDVALAAPERIK